MIQRYTTASLLLIALLCLMTVSPSALYAQTETEPNNGFTTANPMAFATNMSGGGLCPGDNDDYFRCVLPAGNKSIRLITTASMTTVGQTGAIYVYLYNKYQQQLDNRYLSLTSTSLIDTFDATCFEGDTFYVRMQYWSGSNCKQYTIRCENTNNFTLQNDTEPNDNFTSAQELMFQKDTTGHLGSQRYMATAVTDNEDYYRCILPAGGTKSLRLTMSSRMVMPGATGAVYYYLYNKYYQQLTNLYVPFGTTTRLDTLDFNCFEGDTFYVRVYNWSGPCKEYRIKMDYTNNFTLQNDTEPNDNFTTALNLPFQKDTTGHLGSQRYLASASDDNEDYYRCILPAGGTKSLRLTMSSRMVVPGATGAIYYYLYNKFQQQLTNVYVPFGNTTHLDTLDFNCFEGDTFYVRVYNWSGPCKEYRIKVDYTNNFTLQNDSEPNDNFTSALNLNFQKDTTGHLGSQRYLATASDDNEDYYRCILPPGGTKSLRLTMSSRMVVPGATGAVYYYLYNKYQQQLTNMYVPFGNTAHLDTLDFNCFEGDTFYVRVYNWSGSCKEYRIKADYTNNFTLQNDSEPNDNFASAQTLTFQKDTTGHLASQRYLAAPSDDNDDYYRCVLPPGGKSLRLTMSTRMVPPGTTGAVYYYFYNRFQQQLANTYVPITNTSRLDTFDFNCFEGDTFYVRVYNWSGPCKEYRIRVDYTNQFTLANDAEPNETMPTAAPILFDKDTSGHLGTQLYTATAARTDADDYFRCIAPQNGLGLRVLTASRAVAQGTTGAMYVYVYSKTGALVGNRYIPLTNTIRRDTLDFPCFASDTFFVRFQDWSGSCKEYNLRLLNTKTGPVQISIDHARFGNNFSFMNTTRFATKYAWNFGDGKTDTVAAPMHTFGNGTFIVRLSATSACGTKQFNDTLKIDGIEYYTPKSAGSDNALGTFNIRAFGAGLDTLATILLKKGTSVYSTIKRRSPNQSELTGTYDFKVVPPGIYDVEIKLSGGLVFNYPAGFEVYKDSPGFRIRTEIIAPSRVRTGGENNYTVKIWNDKGKAANGVRAFIVVSRGVTTNIREILHKRSGVLKVKGDDYNQLTIDRDAYSQLYYQGTFNPNLDTIEVDYDKLYSKYDSMVSIDIDSLFGQPFKGTVYPIFVPYVQAKGAHTLSFKAKTPANGDYTVAAYVTPWTVRQNPVSGETLDYIHDMGLQGAALAEMSPHPALKAVGKSAGYVDIGSQIAFTEFFDWYYGTNVADDAFYGRQGVALTGEVAGELLPFGKRTDEALDQVNTARRQIKRRTENLHFDQDLILSGIKDPKLAKHMSDQLNVLKHKIAEAGDNLTQAQKEALLNNVYQYSVKQGIRLTEKELADLLFPKDIARKKVSSVASMDPNAIYGNEGYGPERYIRKTEGLSYNVTFENVDTAIAPAQIVKVSVSLDPTKYDLSSIYLSNVSFGGKTYLFEDDRKEFYRDIDLRPTKNMKVRVNAKTDTVKGTIYWEFLSLDPQTMNLITDVDDGFLPPNKVSPEGEGGVTFTARLKPSVINRDTVSTFASIYFDDNAPILTNIWTNTIDDGKPVTVLNPTVVVAEDSVMTLTLSGSDAESGFDRYNLYVKIGDSSWSKTPFPVTETGVKLIGTPGETYAFYVLGQDNVGNTETKPQAAEATVKLNRTSKPVGDNSIVLFPNPARTAVNVTVSSAISGPMRIIVTDISGRKAIEASVNHTAGQSNYTLPLTALGSGVYFVGAVINEERLEAKKLVIIR